MISRWPSLIGLVAILLSIASAIALTRSLGAHDSVDKHFVAAFPTRPMRTVSLGSTRLPSPGTIRVVVCPSDNGPALEEGGSFLVLSRGGQTLVREKLDRDEGHGRRCLEAYAHERGEVTATVELAPSAATRVATVERFVHRRFTVLFALPTLGFVLGLALVLFGRSRNNAHTIETPREETSPDEPAPVAPDAPVTWSFAWLMAIGAYVGVHLVNAMIAIGWMALYRPPSIGDGVTLAVTTVVQHGLMALVSFALLGAFDRTTDRRGRFGLATDWRARLGFTKITAKGAAASVLIAAVLVVIAVAATKFIPDLSSSPMGKLLERSPARYAIAFGALIAPFSEELFFRGVMVSAFGQKSLWRGAFWASVIFTLAHAAQLWGAWAGLIPICAVGVTNAVLRAKTKSLSYPWLVHTLYNGALTVSLYFV
ncbi:MAG: CPBP family intramembrane metalloprotease [Myxococcales bacterium]|nr:CPBP family intramembrane metalloprotease [Myxococcales bacterium]